MSEQFLALVPIYGVPVIALCVMLSCLGVPLPSALIMLVGGSLVASGDLPYAPTVGACLTAACTSDQIGYWTGRIGGSRLVSRYAARGTKSRRLVRRARGYLHRRGAIAIFLTRWLLAMIGPYVNPVAGAAGMRWKVFTLSAIPGQMIWVNFYIFLGFMFAKNIVAVAQIAGNASGFLAAGVVALFLGWRITRIVQGRRRRSIKPRGRM
ncbi:DedA family protein [Martelella endophytica]|nr:DedA family protein [Martelella endophytica]